jgi:hypothetical protein
MLLAEPAASGGRKRRGLNAAAGAATRRRRRPNSNLNPISELMSNSNLRALSQTSKLFAGKQSPRDAGYKIPNGARLGRPASPASPAWHGMALHKVRSRHLFRLAGGCGWLQSSIPSSWSISSTTAQRGADAVRRIEVQCRD